ncbi:MAG: AAA family ATPase [Spirochaetales bacterium]|nr:AAA family ATPase [Spirochaetales bacterium]
MSFDGKYDESLWDEFLKAWPPERVAKMPLQEYTQAGGKDTFTYWLEAKLEKYGSIWGGSSFKFGVYSRADKEPKPSQKVRSYNEKYGWYTKDGETPEEAFRATRERIVKVIESVKAGNLKAIDSIDLGPAYKWKIAFHYQDRSKPRVLAIFLHPALAALCGKKANATNISEYHQELVAKKPPGMDILEYSTQLWRERETEAEEKGESTAPSVLPLNTILYGPPGTGKTYNTINHALRIIVRSDPALNERIGDALSGVQLNRELLEEHFYRLVDEKRISFLTFHPSYTYEDFMHGIRPILDPESSSVAYELKDGPFKKMADAARSEFGRSVSSYAIPDSAGIYKMSLGNSLKAEDAEIFEFCRDHGWIAHGFGRDTDFSFLASVKDKDEGIRQVKVRLAELAGYAEDRIGFAAKIIWKFNKELQVGDLVVVSRGNTKVRAIGRVTGEYEYLPEQEIRYCHFRRVEWIVDEADIPVEQIQDKQFSQQTLHALDRDNIHWDNLRNYVERGDVPEIPRNYVLIIDEINRGNIPRIFGELITLLEPDKRLRYKDGKLRGLTVELPGALEDDPPFGVPGNLYVLGTMNTADRSITTLDLALRRRFVFKPMYPKYEVIEDDGLRELLHAMNANIIKLKDKDHQIGHSYFIDKELADLPDILNDSVLPLLEEYFFNDEDQMRAVFGGVQLPGGALKRNEALVVRYVEHDAPNS